MARTLVVKDAGGTTLYSETTVDPPGPPYHPNEYNQHRQRLRVCAELHNMEDPAHPWYAQDITSGEIIFGCICPECATPLP